MYNAELAFIEQNINKAYNEVCEQETFDWKEFLANDGITHRDTWAEALDKAGEWVTCACGVQCAIIPRSASGRPYDPYLKALGNHFAQAIREKDKATAREILEKIEIRSASLIKQILGNNGK